MHHLHGFEGRAVTLEVKPNDTKVKIQLCHANGCRTSEAFVGSRNFTDLASYTFYNATAIDVHDTNRTVSVGFLTDTGSESIHRIMTSCNKHSHNLFLTSKFRLYLQISIINYASIQKQCFLEETILRHNNILHFQTASSDAVPQTGVKFVQLEVGIFSAQISWEPVNRSQLNGPPTGYRLDICNSTCVHINTTNHHIR